MKFRYQVHFTQSCYLMVNYDVYWIFRAYFKHFMISFITEMNSTLVLILILHRFALLKLSLKRCMIIFDIT